MTELSTAAQIRDLLLREPGILDTPEWFDMLDQVAINAGRHDLVGSEIQDDLREAFILLHRASDELTEIQDTIDQVVKDWKYFTTTPNGPGYSTAPFLALTAQMDRWDTGRYAFMDQSDLPDRPRTSERRPITFSDDVVIAGDVEDE